MFFNSHDSTEHKSSISQAILEDFFVDAQRQLQAGVSSEQALGDLFKKIAPLIVNYMNFVQTVRKIKGDQKT